MTSQVLPTRARSNSAPPQLLSRQIKLAEERSQLSQRAALAAAELGYKPPIQSKCELMLSKLNLPEQIQSMNKLIKSFKERVDPLEKFEKIKRGVVIALIPYNILMIAGIVLLVLGFIGGAYMMGGLTLGMLGMLIFLYIKKYLEQYDNKEKDLAVKLKDYKQKILKCTPPNERKDQELEKRLKVLEIKKSQMKSIFHILSEEEITKNSEILREEREIKLQLFPEQSLRILKKDLDEANKNLEANPTDNKLKKNKNEINRQIFEIKLKQRDKERYKASRSELEKFLNFFIKSFGLKNYRQNIEGLL